MRGYIKNKFYADMVNVMCDKSVELEVRFPQPIAKCIRDLAEKRKITVGEFLWQAISHEQYFQSVIDRNGKILIEEPSGALKKVNF